MTFVKYKVYKKDGDNNPILSLIDIPEFQIRGKKKYTGKKAKLQAIYRVFNKVLPNTYTTAQVNDFIDANIFGTSNWAQYHKIYKQVRNEIEVVSSKVNFQYTLLVELKKNTKSPIEDDVLMHFVFCELMGTPIEMYKGIKNPILKLKKEYDTGKSFIVR